MRDGLRLEGGMIPSSVRRMFDQRRELRDSSGVSALIEWRGTSLAVGLANASPSGAMVICSEIPHIGEEVALQLADRAPVPGVVCWVRDGRIGIHFVASLK